MHTMMIVDDSTLIRKKIGREHDEKLFQVVGSAANGKEAIALYQQLKAEVVTMDLTMPELDGIECIEALMAINPEVKIVVISALNDQATGLEALEKGAMGFVTKPFSETALRDSLLEIIQD